MIDIAVDRFCLELHRVSINVNGVPMQRRGNLQRDAIKRLVAAVLGRQMGMDGKGVRRRFEMNLQVIRGVSQRGAFRIRNQRFAGRSRRFPGLLGW